MVRLHVVAQPCSHADGTPSPLQAPIRQRSRSLTPRWAGIAWDWLETIGHHSEIAARDLWDRFSTQKGPIVSHEPSSICQLLNFQQRGLLNAGRTVTKYSGTPRRPQVHNRAKSLQQQKKYEEYGLEEEWLGYTWVCYIEIYATIHGMPLLILQYASATGCRRRFMTVVMFVIRLAGRSRTGATSCWHECEGLRERQRQPTTHTERHSQLGTPDQKSP